MRGKIALVPGFALLLALALACCVPGGFSSGKKEEPKAVEKPTIKNLIGALIDQRDDKAMEMVKNDPALLGARDESGDTCMHAAASLGQVGLITFFLDKGADINAKNNDGDTPLHRASTNGQVLCVQTLLQRGAQVNARNNEGLTPLHDTEEASVAQALMAAGADVNAQTTSPCKMYKPSPDNPGFHDEAMLPAGSTPFATAKFMGREEVATVIESRGGR